MRSEGGASLGPSLPLQAPWSPTGGQRRLIPARSLLNPPYLTKSPPFGAQLAKKASVLCAAPAALLTATRAGNQKR